MKELKILQNTVSCEVSSMSSLSDSVDSGETQKVGRRFVDESNN